MESLLVKIFGFPATLIHGDTLVLDRWLWLKKRLPRVSRKIQLLDVGCGSGAFTIGAAKRGYSAYGLSFEDRNLRVARERATICGVPDTGFETYDIRQLGERADLRNAFDMATCLEVIEHLLNDQKLMRDIAGCLKPGGRLLLTTPYFHYRAITPNEDGPFSNEEDGWHVRRGYTEETLRELCAQAGLEIDAISYCSGFLSQKITYVMRVLTNYHPLLGWAAILPLRIFPPLLDNLVTGLLRWPFFSICLEAHKPVERKLPEKSDGDVR